MAIRTVSPRPILGLVCLLAVLAVLPGAARADWRIDTRLFLSSAHGDMSCLDCHDDLDGAAHPVPDLVNRDQSSFFSPQECYSCHPEVEDDLARGDHAGFKALHPERFAVCVSCHDPHAVGAPETPEQDAGGGLSAADLAEDDRACMACHAEPAPGDPESSQRICFSCHGEGAALPLPAVSRARFHDTAHGAMDCVSCHQDAAAFPHARQTLTPCLSCHEPHTEAEIGDAHLGVDCRACHLKGVTPVRVAGTTTVLAEIRAGTDPVADVHDMALSEGEGCTRCHRPGNAVGAADAALPPKSVLCTVCHAATFTVQDTASFLGLGGLTAGLILLVMMASGCVAGATTSERLGGLFRSMGRGAARMAGFSVVRALFLDVLLQRRLYRRDRTRWLIHACIFWPFAVRCLWGLAALAGTNVLPGHDWVRLLVDKNNPLTALVFDLTGLVLLGGIAAAWIRGSAADASRVPGSPAQDKWALGLIGALVLTGFALEGLRIAQTGSPASSGYAFVGYVLSGLFAQSAAQASYAWGWYVHAALTAACFAYLPFSRLSHIVIAPVVLALKAADDHDHDHGHGRS